MSTTRSRFTLLIAGALIAACAGGGTTSKQAPPDAKLTIAYSALTAKVGESVTLVAHLENAQATVAWSLSGPGALSAASGEEVAFNAQAQGKAAVTASAAGLSASVNIQVVPGGGGDPPAPTTIDVAGRVVNQNGYPIVNQAVFVLGAPSTLTATLGDGTFTIPGVTPPYDLAMVQDAGPIVYVYRGLTRPDPTLYVFTQAGQTNTPPRALTIAGSAFGGDVPQTALDLIRLGFVSPDVDLELNLGQNNATALPVLPGPYLLGVTWNGPEVTTGSLVGLEVRRSPLTGAPTNYWYVEQPGVTVLSGQNLIGPPLTFMPVEAANTQGTITLPPLYALTLKQMALTLDGGAFFFPIYNDTVTLVAPNFSYIAPDIANATTQVCARAANNPPSLVPGLTMTCIDALAPATPDAALNLIAAPQPFAPANNANGVDATTAFAWSPFEGGVHLVAIAPTPGTVSKATYFIFTAGTTTTIPDLSTVGWAFAKGDYNWFVTGFAPFADVDAFTAGIPAAAVFLAPQAKIPPVPNSSVGSGAFRAFTAP